MKRIGFLYEQIVSVENCKAAILAKIAEIQQGGTDEEKADMQNALNILGVTTDE